LAGVDDGVEADGGVWREGGGEGGRERGLDFGILRSETYIKGQKEPERHAFPPSLPPSLPTWSRRLGAAPHLVNQVNIQGLQRNILEVEFLPARGGGREGGRKGLGMNGLLT